MRRSAFTLLELLLAMALFIVLVGMVWNILAIFIRTQNTGTRLAEQSQLARSLSQLMEDDLRAAIQDPIHPFKDSTKWEDDIRRFGLSGTTDTLRIDVIEINPFAAADIAGGSVPRAAKFGEVQSTEPKAAELKTVFYTFRKPNGLARREIDFETPDINAAGAEGSNLSAPEVVDCRFRYFNGAVWTDSWDSLERDGLPVAIEATVQTLPLAEAIRYRKNASAEEKLDKAVSRLGLMVPQRNRIVAYLPASPVRKFETYKRKTPPPKEEELTLNIPPPPPPPVPDVQVPPPPPPELPKEELPAGPQQTWIRGQ
jgi:type II secretory pathway pseudopilin PulG